MTGSTSRTIQQMSLDDHRLLVSHRIIEPDNVESVDVSSFGATFIAQPSRRGTFRRVRDHHQMTVHFVDSLEVVDIGPDRVSLLCRTKGDLSTTKIILHVSPDLFFSAVCAGERNDEADQ